MVFLRLLGFLRPYRWRVVLGVLLGVATVASNVGLLATAAYVISAAAVVPFLAMLTIRPETTGSGARSYAPSAPCGTATRSG